jgi:hypothetical protein
MRNFLNKYIKNGRRKIEFYRLKKEKHNKLYINYILL